jgi:Cellulase (glycosyl hydrolase family 5)/IPT/TIG domain
LPSISISGNHFVDGTGNTIRLLGVNRSGSEYMCTGGGSLVFDGPSTDSSITAMAGWHINAVRLGLNEDCWLGINGFPASMTASAYQLAIVDYVNRLHLQGLYAILELHWNAPGTQQSKGQQVMVDADHGPAFWTSVANTFKGDSRVLFDLYNEPQGISWACLRDGCMAGFQTVGMQTLVNTVRASGATNPILVGGIGYAGDVSQWLTYKPTDPDNAIVASFHTYDFVGNCNNLSCTSTLLPIAATVPLVTGELGETDCAQGYIDTYMPWADTNGISYLGWAWDTNGCNNFPSLISNYDGTPTNFGIGFRDHLAALASSTSPTVTSVSPNSGLPAGGASVTISGSNVSGATGVKFGTTAATTFTVNSATQITATSPAGSGTVDVLVTTPAGTSAASIADHFAYTLPPAAYNSVTPVRLLDTRSGGGPLGPGAVRSLTVAGVTPGAPAGTTAVVLNVTVTDTTAPSYLTVYPAGSTRPLASNLNWVAGETIPNLVTVQVGTGSAITIFNVAGSTDVVVDLEGYFAAPSGTAGGEVALAPARITDTRTGSGQPNAGSTLGPTNTLTVQVTGAGGVPATGVSAAILNVTVTNTTAASFLTIWPTSASRPTASNLNWTAGITIANRVIVPVSATGQISVYNQAGSADMIVDVSGYFTTGTATGKLFTPVSPLRLVDTRTSGQTLSAAGTFTLQVGGQSGVPSGASAVVLNVTVTNTTAPSFLTVYPSTGGRPLSSDLNWVGGQTIPNLVVVTLGTTGAITFYNSAGSADVVVDLAGWFS